MCFFTPLFLSSSFSEGNLRNTVLLKVSDSLFLLGDPLGDARGDPFGDTFTC